MKNFTKNNKKIKKIKKLKFLKKKTYKKNKAGALTANHAEQLWNFYNTNILQFYSTIQNLGIFDLNHLTHLIPDRPEFQNFKQEIYNEIYRQNNTRMQSQQQQFLAFQQPNIFQQQQQQQQQQQAFHQPYQQNKERPSSSYQKQPVKSDGTLDMRFKANRETVVSSSPLSSNQLGKQPINSQLNPLVSDFKPRVNQEDLYYRRDPKIMLTQHALERMSERNITEAIIINIIKQNQYEKGKSNQGPVRIYKGHLDKTKDLYKIITSDDDNPTIITVIRDKDMFTESALISMLDNNISEKQVLNIIEKNQPQEVKGNKQGHRLEFTYTYGGLNITVYTNIEKSKIIGVFAKNMRSFCSQPNDTHMIDYETEGCALQRTDVPEEEWEEVDCGRCAMSYAGIGTSISRSKLQNLCVRGQGILKKQMNIWLRDEAKRDHFRQAPRLYYIHPDFIEAKLGKYKIKHAVISAAVEISNKLLGYNEQVVAFYDCVNSMGHVFNIGKMADDNTVWYICPQTGLNPGEETLKDRFESMHRDRSVQQVSFVLQPWQADLLVDENINPLLISVVDYDKQQRNAGKKQTISKKKYIKKTAKLLKNKK